MGILYKKLCSRAGESIAETLISVFVISVATLSLAIAVVTARNVNKRVENESVAFQVSSAGTPVSGEVQILWSDGGLPSDGGIPSDGSIPSMNVSVSVSSAGGYWFYDGNPS